jgi:peptidyl-tRNA hydrolase, PTH2 family
MDEVKQVIVVRTKYPDGKGGLRSVRSGKLLVQACHAIETWMRIKYLNKFPPSEDELYWMDNGLSSKICLQVNTEEELLEVYNKAKKAGLTVHLVTDAGKTEFDGVPTKTCLAIGPNKKALIDPITSELKLY